MFLTWILVPAVLLLLLTMQLFNCEKSCDIWSTKGSVVQHGSNFTVYCTFKCKNKKVMSSNHPPKPLKHEDYNSTTIYFNVVNINKTRTFSCQSPCPPDEDPCGIDIMAGYPPERPKIQTCIYNVRNGQSEDVTCTWSRGRDTLIRTTWKMLLETETGNVTSEPVDSQLVSQDEFLSATLTVSRSVQLISVRVRAQNQLGSLLSVPANYTLRDIAMPSAPVLGHPECSSRKCNMTVEQAVKTQHLEIQYRAEAQNWTSYLYPGVHMSQLVSISSLEPFKSYHFRGRSRLSSGNWSQWSTNVSSWTQEEAPAKELDVWFTEDTSDLNSLSVYWKELDSSSARGRIIQYNVSVYSHTSRLLFSTHVRAEARNCSVPFCAHCEVKVWAYNSKGLSPPATITTQQTKAKSSQDVHVAADDHSVSISWTKTETTRLHAEYVVEWYPEGRRLQELKWVRLGRNNNHFVLTDMRPAECYEGAAYVYYSDNSVAQTRFTGVIQESVPAAGPSVQDKVEGDKVSVTWTDIPRGHRGGCITKFTIYLENASGKQKHYSVQAPEKVYTIQDLTPAIYSLWVTASTARGEGPAGQKIKFFIKQDSQLSILFVCAVLPILLCLVVVCQFSAVKQRFLVLFKCLMLDAVLDPANSKWAKECTQEKGKMNLHLPPTNMSVAEEEEEPILVDVEELPNQGSDTCSPSDVSLQLTPQLTAVSSLKEPAAVTTYIKSFSLDSDSSDQTHASLDTNSTVDYISSHGPGNMEDDLEEEEFPDMPSFYPCHNPFMEPLKFGGTLTLDAVKMNCSDFFQTSEC